MALIILIICALGSIGLIIYKNVRDSKVYIHEVISSQEVLSQNKYVRYGDGYIKYDTDGAEAIKDGVAIWNISFDMKKPIVDVCGDYSRNTLSMRRVLPKKAAQASRAGSLTVSIGRMAFCETSST